MQSRDVDLEQVAEDRPAARSRKIRERAQRARGTQAFRVMVSCARSQLVVHVDSQHSAGETEARTGCVYLARATGACQTIDSMGEISLPGLRRTSLRSQPPVRNPGPRKQEEAPAGPRPSA
jgi:hypothetical protein